MTFSNDHPEAFLSAVDQFTTTMKRKQTGCSALLVIVLGISMFVLWLAPLHWQRSVFPPADKMVSGPLDGGAWLMVPPLSVFFYFMLKSCFAQLVARRTNATRLLPTGRGFGLLTIFFLICAIAGYAQGISEYWFATPAGVTVRHGWFATSDFYTWTDAATRQISCFRTRGGSKNVHYRVHFHAGPTIDLADTQQQDFANEFLRLLMLTSSAPITTAPHADDRYCPSFILRFLSINEDRSWEYVLPQAR